VQEDFTKKEDTKKKTKKNVTQQGNQQYPQSQRLFLPLPCGSNHPAASVNGASSFFIWA
jgi:hypothetical protein